MVSKNLQEGAKVEGPMIGKIIDETVLMNPSKIEYSKVPDCILECEFCLKFLEDTKMVPGAEKQNRKLRGLYSFRTCIYKSSFGF